MGGQGVAHPMHPKLLRKEQTDVAVPETERGKGKFDVRPNYYGEWTNTIKTYGKR